MYSYGGFFPELASMYGMVLMGFGLVTRRLCSRPDRICIHCCTIVRPAISNLFLRLSFRGWLPYTDVGMRGHRFCDLTDRLTRNRCATAC